jgi:L,D-transpeptidase ErfK/SrfK
VAPQTVSMLLLDGMRFATFSVLFVLMHFVTPFQGWCEHYSLESEIDSVVGAIRSVRAREDETLVDIAREFDLGYDQIVKANPKVNRWLPGEGTEVIIPHSYILPSAARRGVVLNIAELRLYYYPSAGKSGPREVITSPVSIGRMDWKTPLGETKVVKKERDPAWRAPRSIREEHARDGDPLPEVIPGGAPDNPLGRFALRLGIPSYLIHGVDERKAFGIGMRVTHGCIRMYPEDIEPLFDLVPVGTPVLIIDQPIKVGRKGDRVFLSVYQPLDDGEDDDAPAPARVAVNDVLEYLRKQVGSEISLSAEEIFQITEQGDGMPREIARVFSADERDRRVSGDFSTATSREGRSLNEEYDEAMSRYLDQAGPGTSREPREIDKREPRTPDSSEDDDYIRRYLEERY